MSSRFPAGQPGGQVSLRKVNCSQRGPSVLLLSSPPPWKTPSLLPCTQRSQPCSDMWPCCFDAFCWVGFRERAIVILISEEEGHSVASCLI